MFAEVRLFSFISELSQYLYFLSPTRLCVQWRLFFSLTVGAESDSQAFCWHHSTLAKLSVFTREYDIKGIYVIYEANFGRTGTSYRYWGAWKSDDMFLYLHLPLSKHISAQEVIARFGNSHIHIFNIYMLLTFTAAFILYIYFISFSLFTFVFYIIWLRTEYFKPVLQLVEFKCSVHVIAWMEFNHIWANHRKVVPLKMCPVRNGKHQLCANYCRYNVIFALNIYYDIRDI